MTQERHTVTVKARNTMSAVEQAARLLGVGIGQVRYEIVSETKGLFGLLGRQVEISARVMPTERQSSRRQGASRRDQESSRRRVERAARDFRSDARDDRDDRDDRENMVPARVLTADETTALVEELRVFYAGMVERMIGRSVKVTAEVEDGRLALDAESDEMADQISRHPKLAEAFENVIRKKPRHLRQELPFRVFVDASSSRRGHERELIQMAREMSDKVFKDGRPIVLPNRCAYDRKIIHMTLDKDSRVYTKSVGSGNSRKLMILPSRGESAEA